MADGVVGNSRPPALEISREIDDPGVNDDHRAGRGIGVIGDEEAEDAGKERNE